MSIGNPHIYINIAKYTDWIRLVLNDENLSEGVAQSLNPTTKPIIFERRITPQYERIIVISMLSLVAVLCCLFFITFIEHENRHF